MEHLVEWAVLRVTTAERYLIGVNRDTREVVISAPIEVFTPSRRLVSDSNNSSYLLGDTGLVSVQARRAWRHWCREHGEPGFVEVTEEYEAALDALTGGQP